jgi:hypothetical protein
LFYRQEEQEEQKERKSMNNITTEILKKMTFLKIIEQLGFI